MRKPIAPRPGGNGVHEAFGGAAAAGKSVSSSSFSDQALAGTGCERGRIELRGATSAGVRPRFVVGLCDRVIRPA